MSFVTRSCNRPDALKRCCASINNQTDKDFEHVLLVDTVRRGYHFANKQFYVNRHRVTGDYVYLLDDDDYLIEPNFIKYIKNIVTSNSPDVIMVKMQTEANIFPLPDVWKKRPICGSIGTSCFCVSNKVFQLHIKAFTQTCGGDCHFIKEVFKHGYKIFWFDKIIARIDAAHRTHMKK